MKWKFAHAAPTLLILLMSVVSATVGFAYVWKNVEAANIAQQMHNDALLEAPTDAPTGLTPAQVKEVYGLPSTGGVGTIAIINAFDNPNAEGDLAVFSNSFGLPSCTTVNGCFEKHAMAVDMTQKPGWALESSLDVQWAHAIAPTAKILLVEAVSARKADLLAAVDYARNRSDVVAVSMSWGGKEFAGESDLNSHFTSAYGAAFFASSGDTGAGVQWPAVSSNVIAVGGTTLSFDPNHRLVSEKAWAGSGGGISAYEPQPAHQANYVVAKSDGKRAVPDVSYNADPASGYAVYNSFGSTGQKNWFKIGGTSAGTAQWAAIRALSETVSAAQLYKAAASENDSSFHDVIVGGNGSCEFYCTSAAAYDYVTGLGSPRTATF